MPTTPVMGLVLPTVSVTPGPAWATLLNAALTVIDGHTHVSGSGNLITPAAININADLEFNSNDATELRSVRLESQATALVVGTDVGIIYNVAGNPTWNDNSGTASRIVNTSYPAVAGDMLYASSPTAYGRLAIGTTGQVLKVAAGLPVWSAQTNTFSVVTKTAGYTISATDDVILCDDSGASFALALPVSTGGGKQYIIKKTVSSTNAVTINRAASDTISDYSTGLTSTTINTLGEELTLLDATAGVWQAINRRIPGIWNNALTFTPVAGAFGTITGSSFFSRRVGDTLEVRGFFTTGTIAGGDSYITLPTGYTVNTAKIQATATSLVGECRGIGSGGGATALVVSSCYFDASQTSRIYITTISVSGVFTPRSGTGLVASNGDSLALEFCFPVNGWNG